ncbi:hypothetical protein L1281_002244 [Neisseria sp. HSC-16F19]|nr:hypothetical protein [Neisseria sp. HSC-16F19]MCP2041634.1 hypothetical protein [Neisseria sp. HSC-16F19]
MHYFTLNSRDNVHLGFLVMLEDEDAPAEHGCFAVKPQAEDNTAAEYPAEWSVLCRLAAEATLTWQRRGDSIYLQDAAGSDIGRWQQQHVRLMGQDFLLNDLNGVM